MKLTQRRPPKNHAGGRLAAPEATHLPPSNLQCAPPALVSTEIPPRLLALLLVLLTVLAYLPALNAGFIWDDDHYVTENPTLRSPAGLVQIWCDPTATPQYYPLVHSSFWLEYHLWGLNPQGYHAVNVLLQALVAVLLWRVLARLQLPGAWLAAAIFALHPVGVESVAWVTERKNLLAAVFYFGAALVWLRWAEPMPVTDPPGEKSAHSRRWYWLAFVLFIAALFSKTVAGSLPAALLLVVWWKRGRVAPGDVWPLLPFFAAGAGLGLLTAALERTHVGAQGPEWAFTFLERCLIAGRALWFYAGKLLWPADLIFSYPRWQISTGVWWQWLFPLAAVAVVVALWCLRRRLGRGPLVAVLFFSGTLFPALGFANVYPMRYSFVADHFQYLASVGLITLAATGLVSGLRRATFTSPSDALPEFPLKPFNRWLESGVAFALLLVLGTLTWRQCGMYSSPEALWQTTLQRNPGSWLAHVDLGEVLVKQGRTEEAIFHWQQALKLKPDDALAWYDLGVAAAQEGRLADAITNYEQALRFQPDLPKACAKLAWALAASPIPSLRNGPMAVQWAQRADRLAGGADPSVLSTLAAADAEARNFPEAISVLRRALSLSAAQSDPLLRNELQVQLKFYQAGTLFRDLSLTNSVLVP